MSHAADTSAEPATAASSVARLSDAAMREYLSGAALYGDDLGPEGIEAWYEDEREGYADLGAKDRSTYRYPYHELNRRHGYRWLPEETYESVLGFGSAYGDELGPVLRRARSVTIVDPSEAFVRDEIDGVPATYVKPRTDGTLPFDDGTFDLFTCLGVLHHIPNVSFVVGELGRCLAPGRHALLREPVVSMGDWRRPRPGLTRHERGIPRGLLERALDDAGLDVVRATPCVFPVTNRLRALAPEGVWNSRLHVRADAWLSRVTAGRQRYHATSTWQKLQPSAMFYVLRRRGERRTSRLDDAVGSSPSA